MVKYYSETEGMGSFSHNILIISSFSNQLPVYMRRLNDAIARKLCDGAAIKRVNISLSPDRIFKEPVYEAEFNPNYQIMIEVFPETKKAYLHIGNGTSLLALSTLGDAQHFVRELLPDRTAKLCWNPRKTEHTLDFQWMEEDFNALTPTRLAELPVTTYRLRVEGLPGELFLTKPYREENLPETLLALYEVTLFDSIPEEVERAVDLIGQLFDKNPQDFKPKQ